MDTGNNLYTSYLTTFTSPHLISSQLISPQSLAREDLNASLCLYTFCCMGFETIPESLALSILWLLMMFLVRGYPMKAIKTDAPTATCHNDCRGGPLYFRAYQATFSVILSYQNVALTWLNRFNTRQDSRQALRTFWVLVTCQRVDSSVPFPFSVTFLSN
jgi:hypothetical protein